MHYVKFLQSLVETGKVVIKTVDPPDSSEVSAGVDWLIDFEQSWKSTLPLNPPTLLAPSCSWAGQAFYRACQLLMYRELSAKEVSQSLAAACPGNNSDPAVHYSVDLIFRFLPDLLKFSRHLSEQDPLSTTIAQWCVHWPLSSVGATNLSDAQHLQMKQHLGFLTDPCLRQLFADRIIARKSWKHIVNSDIATAVRSSTLELGPFDEVNTQVDKQLEAHGN